MTSITILRRLRCDHLEAVIASFTNPDGEIRYGVFFHRLASGDIPPTQPLFDPLELPNVANLARLAARVIESLGPDSIGPTTH